MAKRKTIAKTKTPARTGGKAKPAAARPRKAKAATAPAGKNPPAVASPPVKAAPTKRNAGLTAAELRHFRELLLLKRATLLGDVASMTNEALGKNRQDASGDLSNMPIHMADIGSDNYEQEFTLGLLESERTLLREIDAALNRMAAGTYGICLGTGEPIGKVRLEAKPWAKYCIDYARRVEKGLAPDIDGEH